MALFEDDVLLTDNGTQTFTRPSRFARPSSRDGKYPVRCGRKTRHCRNATRAARTSSWWSPAVSWVWVAARQLQRLYHVGKFEYPDKGSREQLPLEHVFTMSILEFERLSVAVANGVVHLPQLLREAVVLNRTPPLRPSSSIRSGASTWKTGACRSCLLRPARPRNSASARLPGAAGNHWQSRRGNVAESRPERRRRRRLLGPRTAQSRAVPVRAPRRQRDIQSPQSGADRPCRQLSAGGLHPLGVT